MSRTVLITGATGKFGRVLVQYFLNHGDSVIASGRSEEALHELAREWVIGSGRLNLLEIDLMSDGYATALLDGLDQLQVEPDCLINNARSLEYLKLNDDGSSSSENFLNEFKLGVIVPYQLVMSLSMRPISRLQAVVNIGSIYGAVAPNLRLYNDIMQCPPIQYGVTKAALTHLTKELAVRLADKGIRVNAVAFGGVDGRVGDAFRQRYAELCPLGRMLNEGEIAGPIDMMLSKSSSGITGQILMVDGGWTAW